MDKNKVTEKDPEEKDPEEKDPEDVKDPEEPEKIDYKKLYEEEKTKREKTENNLSRLVKSIEKKDEPKDDELFGMFFRKGKK